MSHPLQQPFDLFLLQRHRNPVDSVYHGILLPADFDIFQFRQQVAVLVPRIGFRIPKKYTPERLRHGTYLQAGPVRPAPHIENLAESPATVQRFHANPPPSPSCRASSRSLPWPSLNGASLSNRIRYIPARYIPYGIPKQISRCPAPL